MSIAGMPGHEGDATRQRAMRHRDAQSSRHGDAGRDAADDFHFDAGRFEREHFFTAAPEHKRVAALQAHHLFAGPGRADHQAFDKVLRRRLAAAALADFDNPGVRTGMRQYGAVYQVVNQDDIGEAEHARCLERQELRVAGAGASQKHLAGGGGLLHGRHRRAGRRCRRRAGHDELSNELVLLLFASDMPTRPG